MCFCLYIHFIDDPPPCLFLNFNVQNFYFVFADGSGVPPGTVPKTCKTCKGSGVVCILCSFFHGMFFTDQYLQIIDGILSS
jgi:hypothetical protein